MASVTPLAFLIFQLMWIVPAEPPVQSSVFGIVTDTNAGFLFGVGVGVGLGVALGVGFGVGLGVGFGVGPGVALDRPESDEVGEATGPDAESSGLSIADGATLPSAIAGGEAVAVAGEVPPPMVRPKMIAAATPTTIAMSP
jgi:hypothetical protein